MIVTEAAVTMSLGLPLRFIFLYKYFLWLQIEAITRNITENKTSPANVDGITQSRFETHRTQLPGYCFIIKN